VQSLEVVSAKKHFKFAVDSISGLVSTNLTSLSFNVESRCDAASVGAFFPSGAPLLAALELPLWLHYTSSVDNMECFRLLGQQCPALTRLQLNTWDEPPADSDAGTEDEEGNYEPASRPLTSLAPLAHLRHLGLSGRPLIRMLAPALPTLTALTALRLSMCLCAHECWVLARMPQLRSLRLDSLSDSSHDRDAGPCLKGARKLAGLTQLVLRMAPTDDYDDGDDERSWVWLFESLVPPPVMLHRLEVWSAFARGAARKVLGSSVEEICASCS
jgi:hypothetical protein